MRVIKFRAWDGIIKRWLNATEVTIECVNGDVVRTYFPEGNKQLNPPNTELSQSTGLHDKNGKEIYEGDVVNASNAYWEVQWSERDARFVFVFPNNNTCLAMDALLDREVIGNIYENPDLLKP